VAYFLGQFWALHGATETGQEYLNRK